VPRPEWVDNCEQHGYIIDKSAKKNVSICGLGQQGQSVVYKSYSNAIQIVTNVASMARDEDTEKQSRALVGVYGTVHRISCYMQ